MKKFLQITHFKCDGCSKYKLVSQRHIIRAGHTCLDGDSLEKFVYRVYHVALCKECYKKK